MIGAALVAWLHGMPAPLALITGATYAGVAYGVMILVWVAWATEAERWQ